MRSFALHVDAPGSSFENQTSESPARSSSQTAYAVPSAPIATSGSNLRDAPLSVTRRFGAHAVPPAGKRDAYTFHACDRMSAHTATASPPLVTAIRADD